LIRNSIAITSPFLCNLCSMTEFQKNSKSKHTHMRGSEQTKGIVSI
jgi:hypothetical protein